MADAQDTTLLVLTSAPLEVRVASALQSAAQALGYPDGCCIMQLAEVDDLRLSIFESDPWSVIALDSAAIEALREAFAFSPGQFAADIPASVAGYTLVAVPGFAECLDDEREKRVAWNRMKSARHPDNPLD